MSLPRILISNDDGYQAAGISTLRAELEKVGEVWMVAPDRERSATSHSISLHRPLRVTKVGERSFCVDGTPTDCVYLGLHHLLPAPPDVVVSGINHGPNLGNDVLYSGTVSAAMEGALFGFRAIALSLCMPEKGSSSRFGPDSFVPAAILARRLVRSAMERPMPAGVLLNVNVPFGLAAEALEVKLCRLGYSDWAEAITVREDPRGRPYFWIGGQRSKNDPIEDSDNNAVAAGNVSVTPIHYDLTDYRAFDYVRSLEIEQTRRVEDRLGSDPLPHPIHPRAAGIARN